jgi:hypothetical protein
MRCDVAGTSTRHAMGQRARARAEELAWPRIVRQYEQLYAAVR